ncbi:ABC transporter permease [Sediminibacillus halophilus]|uniref:ABC-2 type transport system permease protein n=1 Tax=Sediminibacillus halophilus TaxID=482461 RepID=A0A1G9WA57_9BACI|nr:ABC transporter permease [Sediminibacillus halophilus]SDM81339.1 ABC-2 type transport system permease protein [Sediminibacillus halophilus]
MGNLMKTEWFKLRNDRSLWVLTGIIIAYAVLQTMMDRLDGGELAQLNDYYQYYALSFNEQIVSYIPCILAGFFITSEYSRGTMKSLASSGNNRTRIYYAKLVMFSVGAIIISITMPVVMTAISTIAGFPGSLDWSYYLQTIGLTILYAAAFASVMAVFSIMFTDSGKTIGFLLLFFMLADTLLGMISSKLAFLKPVHDNSVFQLSKKIIEINQLGGTEVIKVTVVPVVTFLVFGMVGSLIFKHKEIK